MLTSAIPNKSTIKMYFMVD